MKELVLNPREALYTENPMDTRTIEGALSISQELMLGGSIRVPIYVVRFSEFNHRFAIFNGNRRTRAAEICGVPLPALEIQNQQDFQLAQKNQPTSWHKVEEEEFMNFNGEYFYKDIEALRNRGLLIPAYNRARKRIREAVRRNYPWLC